MIGLLCASLLGLGCAPTVAPNFAPNFAPTSAVAGDSTGAATGLVAEGREADSVPRRGSAAAQLEHARACKRGLRGKSGSARETARQRAVGAYRAVRRYHPAERALGAEGAFRAGELLRSSGADEEALTEFELARDLGHGTEFRPRGGLEFAHLLRRRSRLLDALAAYAEVASMDDVEPRYLEEALYWTGCVQARLGREREARGSWERVARRGRDPLERVRAFDAWASSLVESGDLEAAAGVLELCRGELGAVAEEETQLGLRVQRALEGMRSAEELRRAVAERYRRRQRASGS